MITVHLVDLSRPATVDADDLRTCCGRPVVGLTVTRSPAACTCRRCLDRSGDRPRLQRPLEPTTGKPKKGPTP